MSEGRREAGSGVGLSGLSDMWDENDKKPMPRWVPVSLLALTTVALAVPIVLLRRQWASTAARAVQDAPPPRRTASIPGSRTHARSLHPVQRPVTPAAIPPPPSVSKPAMMKPEDDFNGALYSVKAFGIATMIVTAGAVTTVWGIKLAMGVQDTQEFAHRMRQLILTRMPLLSSRIHRPPNAEDGPHNGDPTSSSSSSSLLHDSEPRAAMGTSTEEEEWSWPSAEERLRIAFQERGFSGWAEAVMYELELEGKAERKTRGHS